MIRLSQLRKEKNLSQKEFAKTFGVAQNTVSNWENENRTVDAETAVKLANYFQVSVDYLLGNTDHPGTVQAIDAQLEGVEFALFGEVKELSEAQKQDVLHFVQFIKSKKKEE